MHSFPALYPKPHNNHVPFRDHTQDDKARWSRKNTTNACRSCRAKKTKCDGGLPTCSHCANLQTECVYEYSDKRRAGTWKSMVDDLQQKNRALEDALLSLKCNSSDEAIEHVQQLRKDRLPSLPVEDEVPFGSSAATSDSDGKHDSETTRPSRNSDGTSAFLPSGQSRYTWGSYHNTPSNTTATVLPPEGITRRAVMSFFSCAATYFYVMSSDARERLIATIYKQPTSSSKSDFCLLCAIAAVGAKYCTNADAIPDSFSRECFEEATSLLQDVVEESPLVAMRVCICLTVYPILDKMTSSRVMLATGLSISRLAMPEWMRNANHTDVMEWARVFRTIAFMECWLASTLGYMFDLRSEEVRLLEPLAASESGMEPHDTTKPYLVQSHIYKIAYLSAQVDARTRHATSLSERELGQLSAKLDSWFRELPESLSLDRACLEDPIPDTMPLLLMHMVNITARVTFYEGVIRLYLNQHETISGESVAYQVFNLPEDVRDTYATFAQQVARIVRLINENQSVIRHCWITIHSCYHAALGLLLQAAQHLASRSGRHEEDLSFAYICMQTLETCNEEDVAAMRLLSRVAPLYQRLEQIADDLATTEKIGLFPVRQRETDASGRLAIASQLAEVASQIVAGIPVHFQSSWIQSAE